MLCAEIAADFDYVGVYDFNSVRVDYQNQNQTR